MRAIYANIPEDLYAALLMRAGDKGLSMPKIVAEILAVAVSAQERADAVKIARPVMRDEKAEESIRIHRKESKMLRTQVRRERRARLRDTAKKIMDEEAKRLRMIASIPPPLPKVEPPIAPLPAAPTTTPDSPYIAPPKPEPKDEPPRRSWDDPFDT